MLRHPDRELAFRVRFQIKSGSLTLSDQTIGEVTGQLLVPIHAFYRAHPPPGQYVFHPAERGHLVPMGGGDDISSEVIVATMGYLDVEALLQVVDLPEAWPVIPSELLSETILSAEIEFEDVDADDEYKLNEPADLEEAAKRYGGRWHLSLPMPLGESIDRGESRANLDRLEFEVDARFARLEEAE